MVLKPGTGSFGTGPQATWILCLSSLPPDSGTLISKGNAKFTLIREHNFGPLSSSPVLFVFSPGEALLTLSSSKLKIKRNKHLKYISLCGMNIYIIQVSLFEWN